MEECKAVRRGECCADYDRECGAAANATGTSTDNATHRGLHSSISGLT